MLFINCKVELTFRWRWAKCCVLFALGNENDNANLIPKILQNTKLYVPVVNLSAKDNQNLSKLLSKGFERSMYWNEDKTKIENKNTTNEYKYFIKSNFVGVNRLFDLIYSNQDSIVKRFNDKSILYQKLLSQVMTSLSMKRTFTTNPLILI